MSLSLQKTQISRDFHRCHDFAGLPWRVSHSLIRPCLHV